MYEDTPIYSHMKALTVSLNNEEMARLDSVLRDEETRYQLCKCAVLDEIAKRDGGKSPTEDTDLPPGIAFRLIKTDTKLK